LKDLQKQLQRVHFLEGWLDVKEKNDMPVGGCESDEFPTYGTEQNVNWDECFPAFLIVIDGINYSKARKKTKIKNKKNLAICRLSRSSWANYKRAPMVWKVLNREYN
jgi:hypothetical protein